MDIYIEQDEKRVGPLRLHEIAELLSKKKIDSESRCWYEELEDWTPLRNTPIYSSFIIKDSSSNGLEEDSEVKVNRGDGESFLIEDRYSSDSEFTEESVSISTPWQRIMARLLDCFLFFFVFFVFVLWRYKRGEYDQFSEFRKFFLIANFFMPFLWLLFESLCLWKFKTTIGKFIMGLQVVSVEGGSDKLQVYIYRALCIWIFGIGMQLPILFLIALLFSLYQLWAVKTTLWDRITRTRVVTVRAFALKHFIWLIAFVFIVLSFYEVTISLFQLDMEKFSAELLDFIKKR